MNSTLNLLVIDLAGSDFHKGEVDVLVNCDFATTHEREAYIETFAEEHETHEFRTSRKRIRGSSRPMGHFAVERGESVTQGLVALR